MRQNKELQPENMKVIADFKQYLLYERQLAQTTITGYMFFITEFAVFLSKDFEEIQRDDVRDFIKYLHARGIKHSSTSNYIITLRSFYNWLSDKTNNEYLGTISFFLSKIIRIKRQRGVVQVPKSEELEKLRAVLHAYKGALSYNKTTDMYKMTLRDTAIFEMLIATGARSAEIRNMRVNDVNLRDNTVLIRCGKGGHQRVSIFNKLTQDTLKEHIDNSHLDEEDKVFVIRNGNMLNYIIKRWAKRAGINNELHAHSFRHYHVTEAQKKGVPTQVVADQVGHVSLNTTRLYTHFDVGHLKNQYENCQL